MVLDAESVIGKLEWDACDDCAHLLITEDDIFSDCDIDEEQLFFSLRFDGDFIHCGMYEQR